MKGRALALVTVALLVAGCGTVDEGPLASLQAMEEAELAYPGSTRLARFGDDQVTGLITGPQSAFFGNQYGTDASDAEVEAFFAAELERRGWTPARSLGALAFEIPGSGDTRARAWERGDVFFRLSFRRRDEFGGLDAETLARYPTVYQARLKPRLPDPPTSPAPMP